MRFVAMILILCLPLSLAVAVISVEGSGGPRDDADDAAMEVLARGQQVFQDNCLMCHSEELPASQRLTAKQWQTEVDKMIGWGAPVPTDQKEPLLAYLTRTHTELKTLRPPDRATIEEVLAPILPQPLTAAGDPERGSSIFAKHCATCHGADARGGELGTSLVEEPVLLRERDFAEVVRKGRRRMPGFELAVKSSEEAHLLAWLRQQRYTLARP
jgi:ubiquinol-cytochrome c reductase cytochrome c subunit